MTKWMALAAAAALTGCIGAGDISDVGPVSKPGEEFPKVAGINLEGEQIVLPAGFKGARNLVAIGFVEEHQVDIDTWIAVADALAEKNPDFRFYEVPAIYEVNAAYRLWINNGMRRGIPAPAARARTVTIYVDRAKFTNALAIPDTDSIHVLLLNSEGRVLWRAAGPATEDKRADLQRAL